MSNEMQYDTERVSRIFGKFYESDRPWIEMGAQMHDHAMLLEKVPVKKFYWDANAFLASLYEVAAYYKIDRPQPQADNYNFEVEALGGKMIYSDSAMPTIDHRDTLIKGPEDLHKIRTPHFYRDGRLLYNMDCVKFSVNFGNKAGWFCGPFSLAVGFVGYVPLLKNMRKRPQFTKDLFDLIIDKVLIPYIRTQKEYCGVTAAFGADAWSNIPHLSVAELEDWIVPVNQKLIAKGKEIGVAVSCGSGYYYEENPDNLNIDLLFKSFDIQIASRGGLPYLTIFPYMPDFPYKRVLEYAAKYRDNAIKPIVRVMLDARLLRNGPIEHIVNVIKRDITGLARDCELGFFLSNIPADTPPEHVHAAVAALHTYSHKPIAQNPDQVEFHLPHFQTFEDWKNDNK